MSGIDLKVGELASPDINPNKQETLIVPEASAAKPKAEAKSVSTKPGDSTSGTGKKADGAEGCNYAFVSQIPGSTIYVGSDVDVKGCRTDGFLTFCPVGEAKPHPIKRTELMHPFGVLMVNDQEVADRILDTMRCLSTPFHVYDAECDGELSCYLEDQPQPGSCVAAGAEMACA